MPIRGPVTYASGSPARIRDRAVDSDVSFSVKSMPMAWVSLPGPLAELAGAAAFAHLLEALQRLQRADQDGRADVLRLADRVQQSVDPVGAVDVGGAGRAVQDRSARRQPHVGVAGRLAVVVGLGFDDPAGAALERDDAAEQGRCDFEHRPVVELGR